MTVGTRIKERLAAVGLTQSDLARRVGLTQPAINKLIKGDSRTSLHLHKIARELETTPAYLSGETDDPFEVVPPPQQLSRDERALLDLFRSLDPSEQPETVEMLRTLVKVINKGRPKPPRKPNPPMSDPVGEADDPPRFLAAA